MGADLGKVARKAVSDPLGAVGDLASGLLGIGKGADKKTYARRQAAEQRNVALAMAGDPTALAMLGAIGGVKPLPFAVTDTQYTWRGATLPAGWSSKTAGWGKAYSKIVDRAASWYRQLGGTKGGGSWEGTTGPVEDAGPLSPATPETTDTSAPPAPKKKSRPTAPAPSAPKPCKYGLRVPDGKGGTRCPKKSEVTPSSGSSASKLSGSGSSKRPCKYGPRDSNGYCPKKPPSSRLTKRQSAAVKKAASAAEKVVLGGLSGAGKAIKAGIAAVGAGTAAAATAAVVLAAAVGWFIGQEINRNWSGQGEAERINQAGKDRRTAMRALAEQLGVYDPTIAGWGLTQAQIQPFTDAFNKRVALIKAGGFS